MVAGLLNGNKILYKGNLMSYTGQTRRVLLTVLDWNVLEDIHVVCYVPPAVFKGVRFTQRSVSILNRGIMRSDRMHR